MTNEKCTKDNGKVCYTGYTQSVATNHQEAIMFGKDLNVKREGFEVVYRAAGMMEAEVVKGRLESSGIPAALDSESSMWPFTVANMGEVRILVQSERAEEARELLGAGSDEDEDEEQEPDTPTA
jgi:hypothetical protein